jgi:hypothetical protein
MFFGIGPFDILANFGDVLLALSLGAIAVFFATIYVEEIKVSVDRLSRYALHFLNG